MSDYYGTEADDQLDQAELGLDDWSTIYGESGDDTITVGNGGANGGPGNDRIIGTTVNSTATYWSPGPITVDLRTGAVFDGYGFNDQLINVNIVHATSFDDILIGNAEDNTFWGNGGNDQVDGGAGYDQVVFWERTYENSEVFYDSISNTFTISTVNSEGAFEISTLNM